jgi:predicted DNA-binding protein (UPF0251 family)
MKGLTLTPKEQVRLQVLNGILEGQISVDEAAEVLGVSERHLWRILAEYRKEGAAALAQGNRGRRANNAIPEETRTQILDSSAAYASSTPVTSRITGRAIGPGWVSPLSPGTCYSEVLLLFGSRESEALPVPPI